MTDSRAISRPKLRAVTGGQEAHLDDEALIRGVLAGDERIARELYQRLVNTVDHTLYRIFGCREQDHDDLVQATFEQIVLTLSTRRFAGACSLKTWASTIATHLGLKTLRSRTRERRVVDRSAVAEDSTPASTHNLETEVHVRAEIERVRDGLLRINPRRAEVVFLRDVLGHDLAEIALMMKLSVAATQSLLVRGRKDLVTELSREERRRKEPRR